MINKLTRSILDATSGIIVHQCNCTTREYVGGLAAAINQKYPNATTRNHQVLGDVVFAQNGEVTIANLYAQKYPGGPGEEFDTESDRLNAFNKGLEKVKVFAEENNIHNIHIPYDIGCKRAGGDIKLYTDAIQSFSNKNQHLTVWMYQFNA